MNGFPDGSFSSVSLLLPLPSRRGHLGLRSCLGLIPRLGRRRAGHFGDLESRIEKPLALLLGASELAHLPRSQLAAFGVAESS